MIIYSLAKNKKLGIEIRITFFLIIYKFFRLYIVFKSFVLEILSLVVNDCKIQTVVKYSFCQTYCSTQQ